MRTTQLIGRSEALIEARRCLGCYDAPCSQACPANVNVPGFIRRLLDDNLEGAGELLFQSCPLATTCGLACPTIDLCEGACTLNQMGQTAVRIGSLQAHVAASCTTPDAVKQPEKPSRVAVVGGGPGGLGCAVQLRRDGHEVHLFDRSDILGGLVDRVIPHHRLPHGVVHHDLKRIKDTGIVLHLNQEVDQTLAEQLYHDFDAVFVGSGLSSLRMLSIAGADSAGVHSAMDYLEQARQNAKDELAPPDLGEQVIVIGGGNVALDAAVMAKRSGAERVIVLYRRTKDQMPGWESEYLEAASLGVEFRWLSVVTQINSVQDDIQSVDVQTMKLTARASDGRRGVAPADAVPTYNLLCDSVIMALGQALDATLLDHFGIEAAKDGTIATDPSTFQTTAAKIFAGGEAATGGATIVYSLNQGMRAGQAIDKWLQERRA